MAQSSPMKIALAGIGKIARDQVADYAARRSISVEEAERILAPNLGYATDEESVLEVA